jgi:hypothetical protein
VKGLVSISTALLVFLLAAAIPAWSQTAQGEIVGTIRDAQGSGVPGAQIHIVNEQTGSIRDLGSDDRGDFRASGFFVGSYRVEVSKEGFQRASLAGVQVSPAAVKRADLTLTVSAVRQEVTVSTSAPAVETEGPTVNGGLPSALYDKPNGTAVDRLFILAPASIADSLR